MSAIAEIRIRVHPRASRNEIGGVRDGVLQVRVTAPPADGEANAAVVKLVAKHLGVAKSAVKITRGHRSRDKTLRIEGLSPAQLDLGVGRAAAGKPAREG